MEEVKEAGMKARIFVSYSRKDSVAARKLINAFKEMKYDVWVDWEDIPPATRWMDQIEEGIEKSDAFIFFISPASIASEVCNIEINHAAKYNKRIIPIVLKDVAANETNDNIRQVNRRSASSMPGLNGFGKPWMLTLNGSPNITSCWKKLLTGTTGKLRVCFCVAMNCAACEMWWMVQKTRSLN